MFAFLNIGLAELVILGGLLGAGVVGLVVALLVVGKGRKD